MCNEVLNNYTRDNRRYSIRTMEGYHYAIKVFFEFIKKNISEIKKKDIESWLMNLSENGRKPRTIKAYFNALKSFFQYCQEENLINNLPTIGIILPKADENIVRYLDSDELSRLRETIKNSVRDKAFFEMFYYTGVRVSEFINILKEDVDWENRLIRIREGKGLKERFVPFTAYCGLKINKYLETRKDDSPYLFVNQHGKPITRQGVHLMFQKYKKNANLEKPFGPHALRHTLAVSLAEKGASNQFIGSILGHKDVNSTRHYAKLTRKIKKRMYDEYK